MGQYVWRSSIASADNIDDSLRAEIARKQRKELTKVKCTDLIKDENDARQKFVSALLHYGFAVISLDQVTLNAIIQYVNACKVFFKSLKDRKNYCLRERNQNNSSYSSYKNSLGGTSNRPGGYEYIDGVKEFLKLSIRDDKSLFPRKPNSIHVKFVNAYKHMREVARACFIAVCNFQVDRIDGEGKDNYIDPKLAKDADSLAYNRSSINVIHYLATTPQNKQAMQPLCQRQYISPYLPKNHLNMGEDNSVIGSSDPSSTHISASETSSRLPLSRMSLSTSSDSSKFSDKGAIKGIEIINFNSPTDVTPCRVHTDDGFLTFIAASGVPGLQVQDKLTAEFLDVERQFNCGDELFCIGGRKLRVYGQHYQIFTPSVHRVVLPYNTQRHSFSYHMDAPS